LLVVLQSEEFPIHAGESHNIAVHLIPPPPDQFDSLIISLFCCSDRGAATISAFVIPPPMRRPRKRTE
jgi:hypothetical protein